MSAPATPKTPVTPTTQTAPEAREYAVLRWLVAATFVVILNETIMVNAIPRLMTTFAVPASTAQWLTSAFMLTMAVVIPVTGWFLQRVTTRQAFGTAMATFSVGTLVCALAPSFWVLLVGRIIQAGGTAVMMPLLMTTLMTVVAAEDRGRVMGNVTLAMSVAPALGPAVSGVILHLATWRWMFGLVLPVAVLVGGLAMRRLRDVGETVPGRVDWTSVALSAVGFGPLVFGLSRLGERGASPLETALALTVGAAAVVGFVLRQRRLQRPTTPTTAPLLDLRVLGHRTYRTGLLLMSVAFMAMLGSMILLPIYLQETRGLSELQAGLLVMPGGLAMGLLGPRVGRVLDARGARILVLPGAVGVLVALAGLTRLGAVTPVWAIVALHVALMVSLAALFTPAFTLSLGALPPHLYSHGSSMLGALQQVAAATGTAVVIAVMTSRQEHLLADGVGAVAARIGGIQWGFGVGAVLALAIVALAWRLPDRADDQADDGAADAPVDPASAPVATSESAGLTPSGA